MIGKIFGIIWKISCIMYIFSKNLRVGLLGVQDIAFTSQGKPLKLLKIILSEHHKIDYMRGKAGLNNLVEQLH